MGDFNEVNNEKLRKLKYIDITSTILNNNKQKYKMILQQYFISDDRKKYEVDDKHVVLSPSDREIEVAKMLGEIYGGNIELIPVVLYPLRN